MFFPALLRVLIVLALPAMTGEAASKLRDSITERYAKYQGNPQSCEFVYYSLFTDGTRDKPEFNGDGKNVSPLRLSIGAPSSESDFPASKSKLESTFGEVRGIFRNEILASPTFAGTDKLSLRNEMNTRLSRVNLVVMDKTFENRHGPVSATEQAGAFLDFDGGLPIPTRLKPRCDCDKTSTGACLPNDLPQRNLRGEFIARSHPEDSTPQMLWGTKRLQAIQSPAANAFTMGHEFSHLLDWAPSDVADCLRKPESIGAATEVTSSNEVKQLFELRNSMNQVIIDKYFERIPEFERMEEQSPKKSQPMEFESGAGTDNIGTVITQLENGTVAEARETLKRVGNPDQLPESVADIFGTRAAVSFIRSHYQTPEARRNAALAVLFTMPPEPHFFTGEAAEILNKTGSKQVNERRALRIMLAHKPFRDLIGCEFTDKPPPVSCF